VRTNTNGSADRQGHTRVTAPLLPYNLEILGEGLLPCLPAAPNVGSRGIFSLVPGTIVVFPTLSLDGGKPWGTGPMPEQNNQAKQARAANIPAARLLTWPERCLRPADRVDYAIRRWVIPVPPVVNRPVAATRGASQSAPHSDVSRSKVLLTEIQAAVGRCLRAEYDTALPIPARLANLLRQLEQQNGQAEQVA
jgi:hypothetical protein